jgi:hypothetical protein
MTVYTTIESPVGELLLVGRPSPRGVLLERVSMDGQRDAPAVRDDWRRDPEAFAEVLLQIRAATSAAWSASSSFSSTRVPCWGTPRDHRRLVRA